MIILLDQDGPLVKSEEGFYARWRRSHPDAFHVPPHLRTTFYIEEQYPLEYHEKIIGVINARGFFRELEPNLEGIAMARWLIGRGHQVFICTAPMPNNDHCAMEKIQWIGEHLGRDFRNKVIVTPDKTLVQGQYLIDDKPEIRGVMTPVWQQVIYDTPCNREIADKPRVTAGRWQEDLLRLPGI